MIQICKKRDIKILLIIILILINPFFVFAKVPTSSPNPAEVTLIDRWDELPFKHQNANNSNWITYVNNNLNPSTSWTQDSENKTSKS